MRDRRIRLSFCEIREQINLAVCFGSPVESRRGGYSSELVLLDRGKFLTDGLLLARFYDLDGCLLN